MLNKLTIIEATNNHHKSIITSVVNSKIYDALKIHGYCLLRDFSTDLSTFSQLVHQMCSTVTVDPARANSEKAIQKVDAGRSALGLHIENGNTPNAPELVFFYCRQAPIVGSRTTLCDGTQLLASLPHDIRHQFSQTLFITRTISEQHWKTYLANEHPLLQKVEQVQPIHLAQMLSMRDEIEGHLNPDHSLTYRLAINPIIKSPLCKQYAFANAVLGPSFSYEAPSYEFKDGSGIDESLKLTLTHLAEPLTSEIPWKDGDIAVIDNWRVMHGRREIIDNGPRELFIGMGNS
jgi:alpha-ketoglutarate-dependent taurine dioxygenase